MQMQHLPCVRTMRMLPGATQTTNARQEQQEVLMPCQLSSKCDQSDPRMIQKCMRKPQTIRMAICVEGTYVQYKQKVFQRIG